MRSNLIYPELRKILVGWGMPVDATESEARSWIDDRVPTLGLYFNFIDVVWTESDRGCVICAAALLDDALEGVLRQYFLTAASPSNGFMKSCGHKTLEAAQETLVDMLLTRRPQPPVGSFAVRTKLARALCLISDEAMFAMDMMRQMRNDAAHLARPFGFVNSEYKIEKLFGPLSTKEQTFLGAMQLAHHQWPENVADPSRRIFEMASASTYFRLLLVKNDPGLAAIRWGDPLGPLDDYYDKLMRDPKSGTAE